MRSPLGPISADVYMYHLETTVLKPFIESRCITYWRYVDDIFIVVHLNTSIESLLDQFNSVDNNIKFTCELQDPTTGNLPFLVVLLIKQNDDNVKRRVYRKKTWTGQDIHYQSRVPMSQKRNQIKNRAFLIRKICSTEFITSELDFLKNVLLKTVIQRLSLIRI